MADQHPMDGRGGQAQAGGDAGRAEPLAAAHPEDALLEAGGGPPGAVGGDAGPVDQAGLAELLRLDPRHPLPISDRQLPVGIECLAELAGLADLVVKALL
jgi:hypothetical protein